MGTQSTELLIMGRSIDALSQFQSLLGTADHELWFSYGEHIPELSEGFLFWGAGRYAYSLRESVPGRHFMAPGPRWLSELPLDLLGRSVTTESFEQAIDSIRDRSVRFKLAETKHDRLKAKRYDGSDLEYLFRQLPELDTAQAQWTEAELSLDYEHRFFVLGGEILTGSPYLVGGRVYSESTPWDRYGEAEAFAALAARELEASSPPSYVLDVAFDLNAECWIIVESNRTWSSGIYGADASRVLEGLKVALTESDWEWAPDPALAIYGSEQLKITADEWISGLIRLF